jgi:hypothetical protein
MLVNFIHIFYTRLLKIDIFIIISEHYFINFALTCLHYFFIVYFFLFFISNRSYVFFYHFWVVFGKKRLINGWLDQNHDGCDLLTMFDQVRVICKVWKRNSVGVGVALRVLFDMVLDHVSFLNIVDFHLFLENRLMKEACFLSEFALAESLQENMMHHPVGLLVVFSNAHAIIDVIDEVVIDVFLDRFIIEIHIVFEFTFEYFPTELFYFGPRFIFIFVFIHNLSEKFIYFRVDFEISLIVDNFAVAVLLGIFASHAAYRVTGEDILSLVKHWCFSLSKPRS